MTFPRPTLLLPLIFLTACGPRGNVSAENVPLESGEVLTLKLQARENDFRRFKQRLATSPPHSRFKLESDLEGVEERLTGARLKLDIYKTSDAAERPKAREDFNAALSGLTDFLREVESRYLAHPK